MNLPLNTSITLLTNYRTGSTAFCDFVSKKYNLINLDEVFHPQQNNTTRYLSTINQKVMIKIMPDHFDHVMVAQALSKSYVIALSRNDFFAQVSSFYVCHMTKHWHDLKLTKRKDNYSVSIDALEIENTINYVVEMQKKYRHLAKCYSQQEFVFEDIVPFFEQSKFNEYHKPDNYIEIYNIVKNKLLDKQLNTIVD